jgi:hypothetical protein
VLFVLPPPVPVIWIEYVPGGVALIVVIVRVDLAPEVVGVTEVGENLAPAPDGSPLALSCTGWAVPLAKKTVTV